jgi:hypothetical protein
MTGEARILENRWLDPNFGELGSTARKSPRPIVQNKASCQGDKPKMASPRAWLIMRNKANFQSPFMVG